jgi:hypothetical protein
MSVDLEREINALVDRLQAEYGWDEWHQKALEYEPLKEGLAKLFGASRSGADSLEHALNVAEEVGIGPGPVIPEVVDAGHLLVGMNEAETMVVIDLGRDMTGHVVFSPDQARQLAGLLRQKADECAKKPTDPPPPGDHRDPLEGSRWGQEQPPCQAHGRTNCSVCYWNDATYRREFGMYVPSPGFPRFGERLRAWLGPEVGGIAATELLALADAIDRDAAELRRELSTELPALLQWVSAITGGATCGSGRDHSPSYSQSGGQIRCSECGHHLISAASWHATHQPITMGDL